MDILENSNDLIVILGMLIVWLVASVRFNDSRITTPGMPGQGMDWKKYLGSMFSFNPGKQSLLIRPPRANTPMPGSYGGGAGTGSGAALPMQRYAPSSCLLSRHI